MKIFSFIAAALSEDEGVPSGSRLLSAAIVAVSLGWITTVIVASIFHKTDYSLPQIGTFLTAVASFDAATIGVLYSVNKITTSVSDIFVNKQQNRQGS